jgi:hypothetical protein
MMVELEAIRGRLGRAPRGCERFLSAGVESARVVMSCRVELALLSLILVVGSLSSGGSSRFSAIRGRREGRPSSFGAAVALPLNSIRTTLVYWGPSLLSLSSL